MNNDTLAVTAYADTRGRPLSAPEIDERLTEIGIHQQDSDRAPNREEISPPSDWRFADQTCWYTTAMIDGWATDTPRKGRNPWGYNCAIRLECAYRLGCITQTDHQRGREALVQRFTHLVRTTEPRREPKKLEFDDWWRYGRRTAAAKTDEEARKELGEHTHNAWTHNPDGHDNDGEPEDKTRFFDREGLRARALADAVMRSATCGYGAVDERFYTYDNGVWAPNNGRIEAAITRLLDNRYRNTHCRNVLDLIRYSPNTARITRDPLPEWINVRNGMIRWADSTLHPHSPEHRCTVQLPVDYSPDATCPAFEQYLAEVLPKDCYEPAGDSPGFIWELIGYVLYSGNPLHIAVLLYGKGRNGKGSLIRLLKRLIGERNCSTVTLHELVENRFRAATLFGKLANLAGDLDARWLDNTATFKAITGGDTIQGEHKYGAVFDFQPWALPVYSTNKAFGSADSSEGWVARWVVVPFPQSFIGREDRNLDARLHTDAELRGILRRAVEALPALMRRGRLPEPASVRAAKSAFVTASDAVRSWLDERCVLDPDQWTPRTHLYQDYRGHTSSDGGKQLSAREFYNRIEQVNGIWAAGRNGVRGFSGVRLLGSGEAAGVAEVADLSTPSRARGEKGSKPATSATGNSDGGPNANGHEFDFEWHGVGPNPYEEYR